jgi:hypothetical protein
MSYLMLLRMKECLFGVAHYYLGELEKSSKTGFGEYHLSSAVQIREILIESQDASNRKSQVIDYAVMPDDLTSEGTIHLNESDILVIKTVESNHRLYSLYKEALSKYNAARAGLVLPNQQPTL